jgi:DNA-binding NarL/FixJ family response regulator
MIRVLLAEDHETVRHGLKLLIDAQSDMRVVAEASDGGSAVERAVTAKPDIAIIDISMPGINGVIAARLLKERMPELAVVVLTRHDDEAYVRELQVAGASAYVLKQSPSSELLRAVRTVAAGKHYLDAALVARAEGVVSSRPVRAHQAISEREAEVLRLMAVGYTNKEIATELHLSIKTVEVHKANAARKLGLRGRIDFIKYAVLRGWLREP